MKSRLALLSALFWCLPFAGCKGSDAARPDPARVGASAAGADGGGAAGSGGASSLGGSGGSGLSAAGEGGGAGTRAEAGAGGTTLARACPTDAPGPTLVELRSPDGVRYCMDRTEVTQGQYALFLSAAAQNPSLKSKIKDQPAICANYPFELITLNPGGSPDSSVYCPASLYDPSAHPDNPVVCVGHCAARAYCQWAGKELCGAPQGGPAPLGKQGEASKSAWSNACTNGGTTTVASPGADGARRCTPIADGHGHGQVSVESEPGCRGATAPYDAILNLGGGVAEWENACDDSGCAARGAMNQSDPNDPSKVIPDDRCAREATSTGAAEWLGFRCCKPLSAGQ